MTTNGRLRQEGSSVRSAIKCAFASTAAKRRAENDRLLPHLRCENRLGLLEEDFECEPRQISANDSELLMPIFASLVAGEKCEGYASIKMRGLRLHLVALPQRLSWRTMAVPSMAGARRK